MEALIKDIELFRAYYDLTNQPRTSYDDNYRDLLNNYPEPIKLIIEQDRVVQPKHLTQQVGKKIFISQCKYVEPEFKLDENSEKMIESICMYLRNDPAFITIKKGYSFEKGLLILGKVGCGKTVLFKAMNKFLKLFAFAKDPNTKYDFCFKLVESWKITELFSRVGFEFIDGISPDPLYNLKEKSICIDDLGSESPASHFGNTVNIIGHILMDRYSYYKEPNPRKGQVITHATTNLDPKNLKIFYGDRVYSRMAELFNYITYRGEDRRFEL